MQNLDKTFIFNNNFARQKAIRHTLTYPILIMYRTQQLNAAYFSLNDYTKLVHNGIHFHNYM